MLNQIIQKINFKLERRIKIIKNWKYKNRIASLSHSLPKIYQNNLTNDVTQADTKIIRANILEDKSLRDLAISHALYIQSSNSIYTFIPKNACTTMRYSIAIDNGYISGLKDINWVHKYYIQMTVDNFKSIASPSYSFVILRCPYRRLVSVFLDKFLKGNKIPHEFRKTYLNNKEYKNICFQDFIIAISSVISSNTLNPHWRPQVDFLIYEDYDRYFALENFGDFIQNISSEIGLKVLDTRNTVKHHTSHIRKLENFTVKPHLLTINELRHLSETGEFPKTEAFYTQELKSIVFNTYHEDIEMYKSKIGIDTLLFA